MNPAFLMAAHVSNAFGYQKKNRAAWRWRDRISRLEGALALQLMSEPSKSKHDGDVLVKTRKKNSVAQTILPENEQSQSEQPSGVAIGFDAALALFDEWSKGPVFVGFLRDGYRSEPL
jgi:hypothetical protein